MFLVQIILLIFLKVLKTSVHIFQDRGRENGRQKESH